MCRRPLRTNLAWKKRSSQFASACLLFLTTAIASIHGAENSISPQSNSALENTGTSSRPAPFVNGQFSLQRGDVVAFLGGADVAAAQHAGHLEALLAAQYQGLDVHFRNFGWEGDTVFAQPRDLGFPPLLAHLQRARVSVIVLQFGRSEALSGRDGLPGFISAYGKLLDQLTAQTPRLLLVTPPPFEKGRGVLPDLRVNNPALSDYAKAIRNLARQRKLPLVDLFAELSGVSAHHPPLTDDGLQLTSRGHALVASGFARQLGLRTVSKAAGDSNEHGAWPSATFERLRLAVVAKNRLWFNYWRPQNWAFLGGDRTEQPSSRDHRDLKVRWFPGEMEKFLPLIEAREKEIAVLAKEAK
jgi:lysophospholipase L1-like esterase